MSVAFGEALRDRLAARARQAIDWPGFRPSAVLVPLVFRPGARPGEPSVVFTVRSAGLPSHAGQISFPGGARDLADPDLVATALREAHEELGLDPAHVTPLGLLDDAATPARYVVTPVVGVIAPGAPPFRPSPREVAEVFELTVQELRAPGVYRDGGEVERDGRRYWLCSYEPPGRNIWGATARILHGLLPLLGGEP